jgi:PAS domain S-box-containing protein
LRTTVIARNLSGEVVALNELKKTKTLYDLALSGSRIGVFDTDLISESSDVSDTWCEIMGTNPDERQGDTKELLLSRIHPDDLPNVLSASKACLKGDVPRAISEFRVSFPNEEWRWMRADAVIVERDRTGFALRMIGTQHDVTELRQAQTSLEQSEKQFRQVFAAAPIGMALMSSDGALEGVNKAFVDLCGYTEFELLNTHALSDMLSSDEFVALQGAVSELTETHGVYQAEHRFFHKSSEERWGLFNISRVLDPHAKQDLFIAQINDITAQKEIEKVKNEFVSTVSHELRTPLTSIKGALGLIHASNSGDLSKASERLIEIARSNTDRLAAIVNDILDLETISAGRVGFDFATVDMRAMIESTLHEMSPFAQTHENTLLDDLPQEPLWVLADQSRTKQVLANLISNACKYSKAETPVRIHADTADGRVVVSITNQGPGIPEAFKPRMFAAFSQADASDTRTKGGTGLGLNISQQIVERHDGQIGFETEPDGSTTFWFSYASEPDAPVSNQASSGMPDVWERKREVLHIEDDADFAEIIRSGLEGVANVINVRTIATALKVLLQVDAEFDVIILDWALPDGDASELLDTITEVHPGAYIFTLSAESDRRIEPRIGAQLVKTRTDLATIVDYVSGSGRRAPLEHHTKDDGIK